MPSACPVGAKARSRARRWCASLPPISRSNRAFALDRDPLHDPALGVVGDAVVLDPAVVPEGDRVGSPLEPALELRRTDMIAEKREQDGVFPLGETLDEHGPLPVDEQALAPGLGIGPD